MTDSNVDLKRRAAIAVVAPWAHALKAKGLAREVFLFGSILGIERERFGAGPRSDVDLVLTIPVELEGDAVKRAALTTDVRGELQALERDLFLALKRDTISPLVSANLLAGWEAEKAVHKSLRPTLFRGASFKEIGSIDDAPRALAVVVDDGFFSLNERLTSAIALIQKLRNGYLKTDLHGHEYPMEEFEAEEPDPVAKTLLRAAAEVASCERGQTTSSRATDTLEGLEFLTVQLNGKLQAHPKTDGLRDFLAVKRRASGFDTPTSPDHLLLIGEVIYDAARSLIRRSPLDRARGAMSRFSV